MTDCKVFYIQCKSQERDTKIVKKCFQVVYLYLYEELHSYLESGILHEMNRWSMLINIQRKILTLTIDEILMNTKEGFDGKFDDLY